MKLFVRYWIPSVIFLVSFCFHLSLISKGPVTIDCLNLALKSQASIESHHLQYLFGTGYPLMVLLGSIFVACGKQLGFTDPVLAVNFISVLFGSMTILVFYLLVQRICCNTLTSILASVLLLLNPLFLDVSTYGVNHAPSLCFLLLGLLSLLRFQDSGNTASLILSALYFGLMGATRLQDLVLLSPALVYIFWAGLQENPLAYAKSKTSYLLLFSSAVILIIFFFHLPYFISDHNDYDHQAGIFWKIGLSENFRGLFSKALITSFSYFIKAFSVFGAVCFGIGLISISRFNRKLLVFTALWLIVPLSFYGNTLTSAPRFFNIMLPATIIPISFLLTSLLKDQRTTWRLVAMISFLLIIFVPLLNTHQTFIRRHHSSLISDYYRWVSRSTETDATIISTDDDLFITYYSKRRTLPKPVGYGYLSPIELKDFKAKLDHLLTDKVPVYITNSALVLYDRHHEFMHLMEDNYRLKLIGREPLELWYLTPFNPQLHLSNLVKVEEKIK